MSAGGFRNYRRVGKTREKLAELLTRLARESRGPEYECWPEDLHRNNPAYVNVAKDCVSWDGYVRKWGDVYKGFHVHSWQSMGEILKSPKHSLGSNGELIGGT
jgi:hypothetical protein